AMREAPDPRLLVEVSLVRLCRPEADTSTAAIVDRLERLERAVPGDRGTPSAPNPTAPAPTSSARQALVPRPPSPPAAPPAVPSTEKRQELAPSVPEGGGVAAPFPTRDELTLAWGDTVLAKLPRKSAMRFQIGRFMASDDDVAVFALPNPVHRDRCEEVRAEVEMALAEHFQRPIPLRVVVDSGSAPPPKPQASADDDVDIGDLRDAPPGTLASPVDHVLQAFEGAKVVEEP
ncbi:MAG: hypothetical protein M3Z84_09035, partial [Actinomycetota bacterium]|nr:hypothetical protein [Actinomycetota bacterium]